MIVVLSAILAALVPLCAFGFSATTDGRADTTTPVPATSGGEVAGNSITSTDNGVVAGGETVPSTTNGKPDPVPESGPTPPSFVNTKSFNFDGIDSYANHGIIPVTNATVSAWVYPIGLESSPSEYMILADDGDKFNNQLRLLANGSIQWAHNGGGNFIITTATGLVGSTNWHHVLGTTDGTNAYVYLDGVQVGTASASATGSGYHFIGARNEAGSAAYELFFQGYIDEVFIGRERVSPATVAAIYNSGTPADMSSIDGGVAWFRMGDSPDTYTNLIERIDGIFDAETVNAAANSIVEQTP